MAVPIRSGSGPSHPFGERDRGSGLRAGETSPLLQSVRDDEHGGAALANEIERPVVNTDEVPLHGGA